MDTKKILAIAIVAVVVIAGVAVVLIINDEKGKTNRTYAGGTAGCLRVYGNANNDYYIDNSDVELVQKIIDDNLSWKTDYPFADADCDSDVDADDITFIKSIMGATKTEKAYANILCFATDKVDGYVEKVKVPVTAAGLNYQATTNCAMILMGIKNEFVACACGASPSVEPALAQGLDGLLSHKIGPASTNVDATLAANYVNDKEDPLTVFIFSSANPYDYYNVRPGLKNIGVAMVTIDDSAANPLEYASCMLTLGFMFGAEGNDYVEKSVKMAEWLHNYDDFCKKILDKTNADGFVKKTAVVTSSTKRVSGPTSSNTKNLQYAGLIAALTPENTAGLGTGNNLAYDYEKDTWLNNINVDVCIMLTSSYNDNWKWYSGENTVSKTNVGTAITNSIVQFSTMKNYKNTICTALNYPAPFRNMIVCEFAYPDLFEGEKSTKEYMQEFFHEFAGWDADCMKDYVLFLTPEMLGLLSPAA